MGVTSYAGTNIHVERGLKKSIGHVVDVFRLPLFELLTRQRRVMDMIVQSNFSEAGLAVAVGKNYQSSAHVDDDMGFTFA